MAQEIEMTKEEQITMYMKYSKKELCEMLVEANRHLKNLPVSVNRNSSKTKGNKKEPPTSYSEWCKKLKDV